MTARVAVVPGRNAIGIELPNDKREKVYLRELLDADDYNGSAAKLPLCLGKTIGGESVIVDLARMPHLLIAGTTGSGKSVGINTMILSLLYRLPPDRCKLIMIDPKMLELSVYEGIPHLLSPVVTDPRKAVVALKWAVREMEERYRRMSKVGVRNIDGYNARMKQAAAKGERVQRTVQTGFDAETGEPIFEQEQIDLSPMPYIVVIIDEMADLMLTAGKEIEAAVRQMTDEMRDALTTAAAPMKRLSTVTAASTRMRCRRGGACRQAAKSRRSASPTRAAERPIGPPPRRTSRARPAACWLPWSASRCAIPARPARHSRC